MAILTSDDGKIKMTLTEGASIPKANINSESVKDVILSVKNGSDIKVQAVTSPMSLGSNITINANELGITEAFEAFRKELINGT